MEIDFKFNQLQELYSSSEIQKRVKELAAKISQDYRGQDLYILGILKGSFVFMADLIRSLTIPCIVDFLKASSYGNSVTSSGKVRIEYSADVSGKHILILDDILDTGQTLTKIIETLQIQVPASIKICTLLDKPERREKPVKVEYVGFTIPDVFVVGYGIDFSERYRELPYLAKLYQ